MKGFYPTEVISFWLEQHHSTPDSYSWPKVAVFSFCKPRSLYLRSNEWKNLFLPQHWIWYESMFHTEEWLSLHAVTKLWASSVTKHANAAFKQDLQDATAKTQLFPFIWVGMSIFTAVVQAAGVSAKKSSDLFLERSLFHVAGF